MKHPITDIQWIKADKLKANDYNPNVVFDPELKLLKHSLLTNGWIQPVLVDQNYEIIDGYHRYWLTLNDKQVSKLSDGNVPVCIMDLSKPQRMLLTIRINRAKGSHVSIKMQQIVTQLIDEGLTMEEIMQGIGASKAEIELLMMQDVFDAKKSKDAKYSKAWIPEKANG